MFSLVCLDDIKYKITKIFQVPIIRQNEYQMAFLFLVRMEQKMMLPVEYKILQEGQQVLAKSPIFQVRPFMDSFGVVRIKGRIIDNHRKNTI